MKQLLVLAASILLGIYLFNVIAGPGPESVYSNVRELWIREQQVRTVRVEGGRS